MYRKKLIQKLQQLVDKLPVSDKRKEVKQDLLNLKLSKTDYHFITLQDKYKNEE
jgi:phosphoenolpyruvate carboxylase